MGMFDWARALFNKGSRTLQLNECLFELQVETYYKKLAIDTCIGLIAKALARCEFETYERGRQTRKTLHYMLNIQPNQNQNATHFFHEAVTKLLYEGKCLIINDAGNQYLIADDFDRLEFAFKANIYKNITVRDYQLKGIYEEKDVFYLRLNDKRITQLIDNLYESYGKLIASAMMNYRRKNGKRYMMKGDFLRPQDDKTQKEVDAFLFEQMKPFMNPDVGGAVYQLQEGYELTDMSDDQKGAQTQNGNLDIKDLIEGVFDYVAMAFHIPRGLLKGDLADIETQVDNFIMFAVNPYAEMISDEFNRKLYTPKDHSERTYLKMDTTKIKITDIGKIAVAFEKLFSIGSYTINDVIEALGGDPIDDELLNKRYVTKNYERVDITERENLNEAKN